MPDLPHIRPMQEADLAAVLAIQARCYAGDIPESAQAFLSKLQASPATCFVATRGQQLAGYLLALPVTPPDLPALDARHYRVPEQPDCLYLHDLAVDPAARSQGTGQRLIGQFWTTARQLALPRTLLIAIQGSAPFWARHGFCPEPATSAALYQKLASYGAGAQLMGACPLPD